MAAFAYVIEIGASYLFTPEFISLTVAVALWVGGRRKLPFIKWEMNGDPGYDFGKITVKTFHYPYYYVLHSNDLKKMLMFLTGTTRKHIKCVSFLIRDFVEVFFSTPQVG